MGVRQHPPRIVPHGFHELHQPNTRVHRQHFRCQRFDRNPRPTRFEELPQSLYPHVDNRWRRGSNTRGDPILPGLEGEKEVHRASAMGGTTSSTLGSVPTLAPRCRVVVGEDACMLHAMLIMVPCGRTDSIEIGRASHTRRDSTSEYMYVFYGHLTHILGRPGCTHRASTEWRGRARPSVG